MSLIGSAPTRLVPPFLAINPSTDIDQLLGDIAWLLISDAELAFEIKKAGN